jgi:hypothetical protein
MPAQSAQSADFLASRRRQPDDNTDGRAAGVADIGRRLAKPAPDFSQDIPPDIEDN